MLGDPNTLGTQPQPETDPKVELAETEVSYIKLWQKRILDARDRKYKADFDRMRDNMDFVAGIQWNGQKGINYDKYVVNMTLRTINHGVAMLYARNPQVVARPRPKMEFEIWDGNPQTIMLGQQIMQMGQMLGLPVPPDIIATMQDFQRGMMRRKLVQKVGETLQHVFQYQMDSQNPRFKKQMKQLVRRVRVCGVGYIRVFFARHGGTPEMTQSVTRMSAQDRMALAQGLIDKIRKGEVPETGPEMAQLQTLIASLGVSPMDSEAYEVDEHLVFDFPRATSIIPDPDTRMLNGFIGAKWVAEELYYPLDFVNAVYHTDIKPSSGESADDGVKTYGADRKADLPGQGETDHTGKKVRLWRVDHVDTKSHFIVCEGYKKWVLPPQPLTPATKNFWNLIPVTLNDVEVEEECKATIFPPSDVDLIKPMQKEWNRIRQALRRHRKANGPKYVYPDGIVSEEDLDRLIESEDQDFVKLKGLLPGVDPSKVVVPLGTVDIKDELYNAEPLREDSLLATGQQEANLGPAQPNVTATVGTIAEQSRMSVAASDVDGLDDALTEVAQCGGEMCVREMSIDTVKRIAGIGAVWPQTEREDFLNEIELEVLAASSGRPNKAIEVANWERIAPLLANAGANPLAIIKESIRRLDDRLQVEEFFPLPVPQMPMADQQQPQQGGEPSQGPPKQARPPGKPGRKPLQPVPSGAAVPLPGA